MNVSASDFAKAAHLPEDYISDIIDGKASVTPQTAVAFEMVTKIPATLWIKMQHDYDDYTLSQKKSSWDDSFMKFAKPSKVTVL